ncbi:hypothetical protein BJ875DRAFT_477959 [Amylocarpus encephaloides]|uniref:Zn(2)-C6 fungal-type domain-containing protein n=1 Tax=Amylocarpus encephaloides TaxID=45428 RepID=A0A9P7Y7N8_9HELO|nr:hypothetical protein BJ875DRAFT_477959 [Amylocarpus encephaloides]
MDHGYCADFKVFHEEFCTIRDETARILVGDGLRRSLQDIGQNGGTKTIMEAYHSAGFPEICPSSCFRDPIALSRTHPKQRAITELTPVLDGEASLSRIHVESPKTAVGAASSVVNLRSRKGHKKSRQGCFNCKKRKIKCQETQPACANCSKIKLNCSYPAPKTFSALQRSALYAPTPVTSINLQATPTIFSLTDMRLFHHFLQEAYPHLPVGNDVAWTSQVPLIAHHNEYVMHAILGMAATHLQRVTNVSLETVALQHRHLAIKGSNEAICRPNRTGSEGDALLASCYLLAFQSSYMPDGMEEFFRMTRGCSLLNVQLISENIPMVFFLPHKYHFTVMQERLIELPVIKSSLRGGARSSLDALPTILVDNLQTEFYPLLVDIVEALSESSLKAYFKFLVSYQAVIRMGPSDFSHFISGSNIPSRILLVHFLAIELIMEPIINREFGNRGRAMPTRYHLDWIILAYIEVPANLKHFLVWPMEVASAAAGKPGRQVMEQMTAVEPNS